MSHSTVAVTVIINRKPFTFDHVIVTPDEIRRVAGAPPNYEVWAVVGSPDPVGELPDDDVQVTTRIEVKDRDQFRVVPPGTFG